MRARSWLAYAAFSVLLLSGCTNEVGYDDVSENNSDRLNAYTKAWVKTYGLVPPDQNWCMLDVAKATITAADSITTEIYSAAPTCGGHVKGIAKGNAELLIDIPQRADELYAIMHTPSGEVVAEGYCTIESGAVNVAVSNLVPKAQSRYAHDPSFFDAIIVCEDLGTINGDFDFNDVVLGLRRVAGPDQLKIYPLAAGGLLKANVIYGNNDLGEIHELVSNGAITDGFINTISSFEKGGSALVFYISSSWNIRDNWKDIKLRITDRGEAYDIRACEDGNAPQLLCLGGDFFWPTEYTSIEKSYPNFKAWATGEYKDDETTWIDNKIDDKVVHWQIDDVRSWFSVTTSYGSNISLRGMIIPTGVEYDYEAPAGSASSGLFSGQSSITSLDIDGSHFDTSAATQMSGMFYNCSGLRTLNLNDWNTSKVTTMSGMFNNCSNLETLETNNWNTSNVTNMGGMFSNCSRLTNIDPSDWDVSNVKDMGGMFNHCYNLQVLDVSKWNTSNVEGLGGVFSDCSGLRGLDVSKWNTSSATSMSGTFYNCQNVPVIDVSNWTTDNVTNMAQMFQNCGKLTNLDVSRWNTGNVTNMSQMFMHCYQIPSLDVSRWNTCNVTNMSQMFKYCGGLTTLDVSHWNTGNVTDMSSMFENCGLLNNLDVSNWDTSNVTDLGYTFSGCSGLTALDVSKWNTSNVTNLRSTFYGYAGSSLDVSNWNTSNVTCMVSTFECCDCFSNLDAFRNWDTSNVTNMDYMFMICDGLADISAINNWDMSNVMYIESMFEQCVDLRSADLHSWNTSNVTTMEELFKNCYELSNVNIGKWDTSKVKSMYGMFVNTKLTSLDLSNWNTYNVTNMAYMFYGCSNLTDLNLSKFDTTKVTVINDMFDGCPSGLNITCTSAFRTWCINNANKIKLPTPLRNSASAQWHIVD